MSASAVKASISLILPLRGTGSKVFHVGGLLNIATCKVEVEGQTRMRMDAGKRKDVADWDLALGCPMTQPANERWISSMIQHFDFPAGAPPDSCDSEFLSVHLGRSRKKLLQTQISYRTKALFWHVQGLTLGFPGMLMHVLVCACHTLLYVQVSFGLFHLKATTTSHAFVLSPTSSSFIILCDHISVVGWVLIHLPHGSIRFTCKST